MVVLATCDKCGAPVPVVTVILPPSAQPAVRAPDSAPAPERERRPLLMKIPAAARELGISQATLYQLLNAGEIKRVRLGPNAVRIPYTEIEAFVARKLG